MGPGDGRPPGPPNPELQNGPHPQPAAPKDSFVTWLGGNNRPIAEPSHREKYTHPPGTEGAVPTSTPPGLNNVHTVEPVRGAGRSPKGPKPSVTGSCDDDFYADPIKLPARTTLMGPGGPHRKYYVSVHVRMLWMRNIQSRRCRNRSRIHNLAQKPRTSQVHRFSPDLIGQLGNRIPPGIRMGFRILWGIAQRAGGIRSLDPIQIHRSVGRRCLWVGPGPLLGAQASGPRRSVSL